MQTLVMSALAGIDETCDQAVELNCNVFIGTTFKQCELFLSFIHNKVKRIIDLAHKTTLDIDRVKLLEPIRDMAGMPPHLLDTIEMAIFLCNAHGGFSDEDLAEYILSNQPQAPNIAVGWHPDTVAGAIGRLAQ